jgi:hypothetical protein
MSPISNQVTERLMTLREVSVALSVPLFVVRRAAKNGEFPIYYIGNRRQRTRLSEVIAAVERRAKEDAETSCSVACWHKARP